MEEIDKKMNWTAEEIREMNENVKYMRIAYTIREIRLSKKLTQQLTNKTTKKAMSE
jgi:hypothetical protein